MPIKLTTQAYCKMVLHAAKYPHCAVNGLLVAEKQKDKKKEGHSNQVLCVDCVPLFHGTLALAPMLEVALSLIDTWCKENKYVIAGYYQGNERIKDPRPNQVAEKVAARILENFSEAGLIIVDNSRFTMGCFQPALSIYDHLDNKWKCRDPSILKPIEHLWDQLGRQLWQPTSVQDLQFQLQLLRANVLQDTIQNLDSFEDWTEAQKITSALLENRSYENLIDFDNHLDDLRNDWTNPEINKSVLHLC